MTEFTYQALTQTGAVTRGEMVAASEEEVEERLREQGQFLITASPREAAVPTRAPARRHTDGQVSRRDLLAFTEYLAGAAQAGLPILTTLADVEVQLESKRLRRITAELRDSMVVEGKTLSEAMAMHPRAFPQLYVRTVEAGEMTGRLDYTLQQLVAYIEWQQEIGSQLRQATTYPIIVLSVMAVLIVMLVTFVYPRLFPVFTGFNVELPLPTRIVMAVGGFLQTRWYLLPLGVVAITALLRLVRSLPGGRLAYDSIKLRLPLVGPLIHQIEMARVVTYIGLFYRTGIELLRGLDLVEQMVDNRRVALAVRSARDSIAGGESIATAMAATGLFPQVVIRSFALGETTGRLDDTLERVRIYYSREVPAAVKRMLSALQPLLVVVLGALLAVIALSIFLPILNIYNSIGP